jgi:hypothetical protein
MSTRKKSKISAAQWTAIGILGAALVGGFATVIVAIIQKFPTPTATPIEIETLSPPGECSITNLGWVEYQNDNLGSTINVSPVLQTNCEIKILFDLKTSGWVAIYKKLEPNLLSQTHGIKFSYIGTGVANTLEFKLIEKDAGGNETIYYAQWGGATSTAGKEITQNIKYSDLICRSTPNSNCKIGNEHIKPELADRIDFSFSNKPTGGAMPGQGEVIIKEIQIIP